MLASLTLSTEYVCFYFNVFCPYLLQAVFQAWTLPAASSLTVRNWVSQPYSTGIKPHRIVKNLMVGITVWLHMQEACQWVLTGQNTMCCGFVGESEAWRFGTPFPAAAKPSILPSCSPTGQPELRTPSDLSTAASARLLKGHLPQTEPVGADLLSPQGIFPGSSSKSYAQHTQCTSSRSEPQLWGHHSRVAPDWRPHIQTHAHTYTHPKELHTLNKDRSCWGWHSPHLQLGETHTLLINTNWEILVFWKETGWSLDSCLKPSWREFPLLEKNILPARIGITSTRNGCFQQSFCLGHFSSSGPASRKPAFALQTSRRLSFPSTVLSGDPEMKETCEHETCPCPQQPWNMEKGRVRGRQGELHNRAT